ncbi:hypothetical protein BJV82DRAFT_585136 [Fennellomyces sp. T-0311]|nr:hypothetical protein BJV82DRAFT_585136 [Fennellomyces sp. T-0311]
MSNFSPVGSSSLVFSQFCLYTGSSIPRNRYLSWISSYSHIQKCPLYVSSVRPCMPTYLKSKISLLVVFVSHNTDHKQLECWMISCLLHIFILHRNQYNRLLIGTSLCGHTPTAPEKSAQEASAQAPNENEKDVSAARVRKRVTNTKSMLIDHVIFLLYDPRQMFDGRKKKS